MAQSAKTWAARSKSRYDDRRVKTAERGYDQRWRNFRSWFLAQHPLCQDCGRQVATEVHHVVKIVEDRSRRLDSSNCMALCKVCHARRTGVGE